MAISVSLFIQGIMILGYLFSGLFTTYYVISERWYQNYTDFEVCGNLPACLILNQVVNLTLVVYLIGLNIYRCMCKAITNSKVTVGFTCCGLIYILLVLGAYIFATYVYFKKICYDDYIKNYPHLWLCLEVALLTLVIIFGICIIGGLALCIINKKNKKAKVINDEKSLNMV